MTASTHTNRPRGLSASEVLIYHSVAHSSGCILMTSGVGKDGYSQISFRGKLVSAHRLSWRARRSPIPPGMTVDHNCHNAAAYRGECSGGPTCIHRRCINPTHLRLMTMTDNWLASPYTSQGKAKRKESDAKRDSRVSVSA